MYQRYHIFSPGSCTLPRHKWFSMYKHVSVPAARFIFFLGLRLCHRTQSLSRVLWAWTSWHICFSSGTLPPNAINLSGNHHTVQYHIDSLTISSLGWRWELSFLCFFFRLYHGRIFPWYGLQPQLRPLDCREPVHALALTAAPILPFKGKGLCMHFCAKLSRSPYHVRVRTRKNEQNEGNPTRVRTRKNE